jgi:hypothetical protein
MPCKGEILSTFIEGYANGSERSRTSASETPSGSCSRCRSERRATSSSAFGPIHRPAAVHSLDLDERAVAFLHDQPAVDLQHRATVLVLVRDVGVSVEQLLLRRLAPYIGLARSHLRSLQ